MKNVCIFLLLILPLTGVANPYEDISSLKTGDWIRFEIVGYYPEKCFDIQENVPWRTENIRKMVIKATVLEKTGSELTLGYQLEYLTDCRNDSVGSGFYYYDSRYRNDFKKISMATNENQKKLEDFLAQTADEYFAQGTYDIKTGKLLSSSYISENMTFLYSLRHFSKGIVWTIRNNLFGYKSGMWNLGSFPSSTAGQFIAQWYTNGINRSGMPLKITGGSSSGYQPETRVTDASFPLPDNVSLTYMYLNEKTKKQEIKICTFFSASPQRYKFLGYEWMIMPGDSIVFNRNEKGEKRFSGRGAAPNNFKKALEEEDGRLHVSDPLYSGPFSSETHLKKWNAVYDQLYARYAPEMDSFWKISLKLTQSYYNNKTLLRYYLLDTEETPEKSPIDWHSESIRQMSLFTDYALLPDFYGNFLNNYVQFKLRQLYYDNLTSLKINWQTIELYHFERQILSGYPKYKANANTLQFIMQYYTLQEIQREYNEFITECPDSLLTREVKEQYNRFMKIEPGEYIQRSDLDLAKEIPIKKGKRKSYTLLNISLESITNLTMESIMQKDTSILKIANILEKNGLSECVTPRLYRPELSKKAMVSEKIKRQFIFLPHWQLAQYIGQVTYANFTLTLLVRNDGKIMFRSFDSFDNILVQKIIRTIKEDLNKQEPATAGSSFWLRILISFCIGGITVFIWGRIRQRKEKSKRLLAQLEMKALRSQMNPHFIFNALNSIQNLITRPDVEQANRYLLNFAKLLRLVLSTSEKKLVPLSEEIEQLRLYVDLEQLRLPFEAEIQISDTVNQEMTEIPGMLIQPLVENAIKHGIVPQGGGKIEIRFEQTDTFLKITVEDNGPGIPEGNPDEGSGFGLKAVRERLKLLQSEYHAVISMRTENRKNRSGCRITLSIPLE